MMSVSFFMAYHTSWKFWQASSPATIRRLLKPRHPFPSIARAAAPESVNDRFRGSTLLHKSERFGRSGLSMSERLLWSRRLCKHRFLRTTAARPVAQHSPKRSLTPGKATDVSRFFQDNQANCGIKKLQRAIGSKSYAGDRNDYAGKLDVVTGLKDCHFARATRSAAPCGWSGRAADRGLR